MWHLCSAVVITFFDMSCLFPFYVEKTRTVLLNSGGSSQRSERVPVPCGKCPNCLTRRANSWAFRIMHQERVSHSSLWVTLTYNPATVRITPNGYMTLVKRDVQLFIKRVRKSIFDDWRKANRALARKHQALLPQPLPVKYYCCGEYGSQFWRPHYHIVLLNVPESSLHRAWYDAETAEVMGDVYIDPRPLSESCIAYTVFYCNKGSRVPAHKNDDRSKEFSLMSKGMGLSYLTPAIRDYHLADLSRNYVTLPGGGKTALPRYYADRLFTDEDKENMQDLLQTASRLASKAAFDQHVAVYGNGDDFIRSQNAARHAAIVTFQQKAKRRS